jgi:hypothetical protein
MIAPFVDELAEKHPGLVRGRGSPGHRHFKGQQADLKSFLMHEHILAFLVIPQRLLKLLLHATLLAAILASQCIIIASCAKSHHWLLLLHVTSSVIMIKV